MTYRSRAAAAAAVGALTASALTAPAAAAPRIIDGRVADTNPGAVALLDQTGDQYCTATQISAEWVLTAWHCIYRRNPDDANGPRVPRPPTSLRVGSLQFGSGGRQVTHASYVVHDQADLALIRLAAPSADTPLMKLAAAEVAEKDQPLVWGWGRTAAGNGPSSPDLKLATTKVHGVTGTDGHGGQAVRLSRGDGKPAPGDSGGPATVNGQQVGVCSQSLMLGRLFTYTKISAYRDWIRQKSGV
ncbi:trypsin [Pilimelia terevasa]|uniref:Trypsin n=1 Tax=Pilimelia terevasa TaxID=53372 RepID=A0A8J3FEP6_9ACTN|nr:trypsin-like serine protease [Pilimelia terevasa]GGK14980.1 trypsin [Pilimelia terevasa]